MVALPIPTTPTIDKIYEGYEASEKPRHSNRLGASQFGNPCDRALWYSFRWVSPPETFAGRMLRLFETGHREELRMLANLQTAGVTVEPVDPATGQQWEYTGIAGHLVAKLDGIGRGFAEAPIASHSIETKTHNEKSFKEVVTKGVALAKPGHFAQMQIGMHLSGLPRAYYMAHNKNTDELHQERIAYDPVAAGQLMARAQRIIYAQTPPARLHDDPNHKMAFACKYCPHFAVCHEKTTPGRRNCRTCLHSTPATGGFGCDVFKQINEPYLQERGCSIHLFIPDLVPGEQVDADLDNRTVTYRMADGREWIDGKNSPEAKVLPEGGGPLTDDKATGDVDASGVPSGDVSHSIKSSDPANITDELAVPDFLKRGAA